MVIKKINGSSVEYSFKTIKRINVKNANRIKIKVLRGIANPKINNIIIDLKGLDFMDTFGAKVLITLRKFARRKQKKFILKNISPDFQEIFNLLKIDKDFEVIKN